MSHDTTNSSRKLKKADTFQQKTKKEVDVQKFTILIFFLQWWMPTLQLVFSEFAKIYFIFSKNYFLQ